MKSMVGIKVNSDAANAFDSFVLRRAILYAQTSIAEKNITSRKKRPTLPQSKPKAFNQKSMGPLWSKRSVYGILPSSIPIPIVLNVQLSKPSYTYKGDVDGE
jgi:hypothetical protein